MNAIASELPSPAPAVLRAKGATGRRPTSVPRALAAIAVVTAVLVAIPLVYLFVQARSRGIDQLVDEIWQRRTLDLALRSLALAAVVTIASLVIGIAGAFLTTSTDLPFARAARLLLVLPLALPSYVAAYGWISWRPGLAGFWGAALVITTVSMPFVLLPVSAALRRLDARQEEAARSLGATRGEVFRRITLRAVRAPASAGALLVALYTLSDFGAVATMRFESFTWVIFGAYRAGFNPTRAAVLSLVLIAIACILVVGELRVRGRAVASSTGSGAVRRPRPIPLGRLRWPALALVVAWIIVALVVPIWSISSWLDAGSGLDWTELSGAIWSTVGVAALATVVITVLAVPIALLAARNGRRWAQAAERTVFVTHSLPGIVIGLSVVYVGIRLLPDLYQRTPLLIAGYTVLFVSLAVGAIRGAIESTSAGVDDVARSLGCSPYRALWRVTFPAVRPAIAASATLVFLTVMKELPATILLRPTGFDTLATELWTRTAVADYSAAAPYALAIVVLAAVPAALLTLTRESR